MPVASLALKTTVIGHCRTRGRPLNIPTCELRSPKCKENKSKVNNSRSQQSLQTAESKTPMLKVRDTAKTVSNCLEVGDSWEGVQRLGEQFPTRNSLGSSLMLGVLFWGLFFKKKNNNS